MRTAGLSLALFVSLQLAWGLPQPANIQDLLASIDEVCPIVCRGESMAYLQRYCRCVLREKQFLYGKRNGGGFYNTNRAAAGSLQKLDGLADLGEKLTLLGETTTKEPTGADIGDQLKRLLDLGSKQVDVQVTDTPEFVQQEPMSDLFVSEFGKTIEEASHEDFMRWTEKEMKGAELRLMKLVKFYDFLRDTDPRNSQGHI